MYSIETMESSHDYNNHRVTIMDNDDEEVFDEYLIGFNNTPLYNKLRNLIIDRKVIGIDSLDIYGYRGKLEDLSILPELIKYNENNQKGN